VSLLFFVCIRADDVKFVEEVAAPGRCGSARPEVARAARRPAAAEVAARDEPFVDVTARLEREAASVPFEDIKDFRVFVFVIERARSGSWLLPRDGRGVAGRSLAGCKREMIGWRPAFHP